MCDKHENLSCPTGIDITLTRLIASDQGTAEEPSVAFSKALDTGWYLNADGNITLTTQGSDSIIHHCHTIQYKKPLLLLDQDMSSTHFDKCFTEGGGLLYKKANHSGLWWKTSDAEIDLTQISSQTNSQSQQARSDSKSNQEQTLYLETKNKAQIIDVEIPKALDSALPKELDRALPKELDRTLPKELDRALPKELDRALPKELDRALPKELDRTLPNMIVQSLPKELDRALSKELDRTLPNMVSQLLPKELDRTLPNTVSQSLSKELDRALPKELDRTLPKELDRALPNMVSQSLPKELDRTLPNMVSQSLSKELDRTLPKELYRTLPKELDRALPNMVSQSLPKELDRALPSMVSQLLPKELDRTLPDIISQLPSDLFKYHKQPSDGNQKKPTYSFETDDQTGVFLIETGQLGLSTKGKLTVSSSSDKTTIHNLFTLTDTSKVPEIAHIQEGCLYKKPNDNNLYWATQDNDINLTKPIDTIQLINGTKNQPSLSFKESVKTGFFLTNTSVTSPESQNTTMHVSVNGSQALQITKSGIQLPNSSYNMPSYSFIANRKSGLYYNQQNTNVLGLSLDGLTGFELTNQYITCYKPLILSEQSQNINKDGALYRKSNDPALYWYIAGREYNLIKNNNINYPLHADKLGNNTLPTYSWEKYNTSGMYIKESGHVAICDQKICSAVFQQGHILVGANGSNDLPSYAFQEDIHTGLSYQASDITSGSASLSRSTNLNNTPRLNLNVAGETQLSIGVNTIISNQPHQMQCLGSAQIPAYGFKTPYTGIYINNNDLTTIVGQNHKLVYQIYETPSLYITNKGIEIPSQKELVFHTNMSNSDMPIALTIDPDYDMNLTSHSQLVNTPEAQENMLSITYTGSKVFTAFSDLNKGDLVGIKPNNQVDKVTGIKFYSRKVITVDNTGSHINSLMPDTKQKINYSSLWDNLNEQYDIHLYSYINDTADLILVAAMVNTNIDNVELYQTTELKIAKLKTLDYCPIVIIKLHNADQKYAVVYSNTTELIVNKISFTFTNSTPLLKLEQQWQSTDLLVQSPITTLDATITMDDTLVVVIYQSEQFNLSILMFKVSGHADQSILMGTYIKNISKEPIIVPDKTLRALLVPGQILICSYANYKFLAFLPSSYTENIIVSDNILINMESADCIDMIYDSIHSNIITVEKTISNTAFLQTLDTFGEKLIILNVKKLSQNTLIPMGLGYGINNFILFYIDSNISQQLAIQLFTYNGEYLELGLCCFYKYDNKLPNSLNTEQTYYGQRVYKRECGACTIDLINRDYLICESFKDRNGIPLSASIGFTKNAAQKNSSVEIILKGQLYYNSVPLPDSYIGKKVYYNHNLIYDTYPKTITTKSTGYTFIGTCLSKHHILIGL